MFLLEAERALWSMALAPRRAGTEGLLHKGRGVVQCIIQFRRHHAMQGKAVRIPTSFVDDEADSRRGCVLGNTGEMATTDTRFLKPSFRMYPPAHAVAEEPPPLRRSGSTLGSVDHRSTACHCTSTTHMIKGKVSGSVKSIRSKKKKKGESSFKYTHAQAQLQASREHKSCLCTEESDQSTEHSVE